MWKSIDFYNKSSKSLDSQGLFNILRSQGIFYEFCELLITFYCKLFLWLRSAYELNCDKILFLFFMLTWFKKLKGICTKFYDQI